MVESTEDIKKTVLVDEESEGNSIGSGDFIFRKIGNSVPLKPSDSSFELENVPVQALAISERFRVMFLAHSEGFYVAKTKGVIELAKDIKEKGKGSGSIQESSVVDVSIGRVSILALSTDSSTLAACVGGDILLFSVVSLLRKDKEPSFSCSLGESSHVKDLKWRKNEGNSYVVLSSRGKLYHGDLEGPLKDVMDNVDAVDWGVKGDCIAVARENTLIILSSDFKERFHMFLLFQASANDTGCIRKVDSIKWVRCDSIIIGCIQLNEDGKEEGYLVQVISNYGDEINEASFKPMMISFGELFASIDHDVPLEGGPYLLVNYLERWELVLASNRKNMDQHIVSLGWSLDAKDGEVAAIEFRQDKEVPRIELPESGDDNLIVGFGVDKVSLYEKVEFIKGDGEHKELYPYCVLICLTSDGKLIMFHAARISDPPVPLEVHTLSLGDVTSVVGNSSDVMPLEPTIKDNGTKVVVLDDNPRPMSEEAFDINRGECILKENASQVAEPIESLRFSSVAGQTSGIETSKSIVTYDSDYKTCDSLLVSGNKEPKSIGTIPKSEVDAESNSSPTGQVQGSSGTKAVVLDAKPRPMSEEAFDISRCEGLKENSSQVTEQSESLNFPSVAGQTFGIETSKSIVTYNSEYKSCDSLLVAPNKEPKSDGIIPKSEVDAESNSSPTGKVQDSSGTKAVVLDDKPRPMNEEAFDINRGEGILKENSSQVTEPSKSLNSPSVPDKKFGIETSKSIVAFDSDYKSRDSLLVAANKEPKSDGTIQKSEVDAESNSTSTPQVQDSSGTKVGLPSQHYSKSEQLPVKLPPTQSIGSVLRDVIKTESQKFPLTGSLPSDASATRQQSFKDSVKGNEASKGHIEIMGSSNFQSVLSGSPSSDFNARVLSFASSGSIYSEGHKNTGILTGKPTYFPAGQSSPSTFQSSSINFSLKESRASPSPSVFSSGKPAQSEIQRTAITGARTSGSVSSHGISSLSHEDSMLRKSPNSKGSHFSDNSRTPRLPGTLDSESPLSKSFCNVSDMVKELDNLLSKIEGEGGFRDACTVLQKSSALELEVGLENLSERCRAWKNTTEQLLGDIQHLLDKTMQVLARKIYMEGLIKQASNTQYWEFWNSQKLSPEFELKRQKILKLNQNLVNQIIELERHFNALELNKFGDRGRVPMGWRAFHSSSEPSRQTLSLHSLYNTMNSQLAAAEQLSECLSKQMAVLNIESPPVKKRNVAKELFESIGLTYDGGGFQSPDATIANHTPDSIKKLPLSSFSAIKEHSRRNASSSLKGIEPETMRRRRDSLDRSLARFEPQKTTVKRMFLEERSRVSSNKSSLGIGKEIFNSPMGEGFSVAHQKDHSSSSFSSLPPFTNKDYLNTYHSNKDIQGKSSTQACGSPSVSPFKWAKDKVGASQPVGLESPSMQPRVNLPPLSAAVVASPLSTVQNNIKENMGSAENSSTISTYVAQSGPSAERSVSVYETRYNVQSETPPSSQTSMRISTTALLTKLASPRKTVHIKTQTSEFSNLKSGETVQTKQVAGSMNPGEVTPESSFAVPQIVHVSPFAFQMDTPSRESDQTAISSTFSPLRPSFATPVPSSISPSSPIPALDVPSLSSIPALAASSSSETFPSAMPFGGSFLPSSINKTVPPTSSSSTSTSSFFSSGPLSFQMQKQQVSPPIPSPTENVVSEAPLSQPKVVADELSSKSGPAQPSTPVSKISARLSSGSQPSATTSTFNIFGAASNASPSLNSQPEAPLAAQVLFPASPASSTQGKTEALDTTVTEEDEMEEEAPDTTDLSLGALGGFGLGSITAPSAPKPIPFGGPFGASAASPASPPFSLTVPSGELFRPASFSFSSATPSQPVSHSGFSGFGTVTPPTGSGFGHPAQIGAGQQALGSVLGAFGQSRQLGPSLPGVSFASSSGFGDGFSAAAMSGGFGSGAGFAGASTGGGFAGAASAGGGFAAAATAGGGFAGAATVGFGAFSNKHASGGAFSSFGGSNTIGTGKPPELFTQMRR